MIAYIKGVLASIGTGSVVVDVNGLGYQIKIPSNTPLPVLGQEVKFFTHMSVREDGIQFFGFASEDEKECFLTLLDVAGVGPKVALAVISHLPPINLRSAVALQDVNQLVKVPGVGKKTAQRIMLELKDKLKGLTIEVQNIQPSPTLTVVGSDEAVEALLALGYSQTEAKDAVEKAQKFGSIPDLSLLIKTALKELAPSR
ncbi:Holliday junction branch migration protein RuvA [Desulfotomaculum defluvii]